MKEEIIKCGINVRECPHINAYNPKKPICQMFVGVGGSPSECNGNCAYVRNAEVESKIKNLAELVSWQREKLEKIEKLCKELMSENEEYASITQILQIIRGK